jgi:hypothetical protein
MIDCVAKICFWQAVSLKHACGCPAWSELQRVLQTRAGAPFFSLLSLKLTHRYNLKLRLRQIQSRQSALSQSLSEALE